MSTSRKPKFYSPDGTPIRVCLPDGRVARIDAEPRDIHPAFYKAALREGALHTDLPSAERLKEPTVPVGDDQFTRRKAIKDKIVEALNAEEGAPRYESAFTNTGSPNLDWLSEHVGFKVDRAERDEIWQEVQADLEKGSTGKDDDEGLGLE